MCNLADEQRRPSISRHANKRQWTIHHSFIPESLWNTSFFGNCDSTMKHLCVITLVLLCVLPVFLWPMEESLHPLPAALVEEGFEVTGRHQRIVRSTPTKAAAGSRKISSKSSSPAHHKGSTAPRQTGKKPTAIHYSQSEKEKKAKEGRPTKPGRKYIPRNHQPKNHKKFTESKGHQSGKPSKLHLKNDTP